MARQSGKSDADQDWLLGPKTVTWQLHADPTMWLAGITSLYLQSLHPLAAAGVVQNSTFQSDPIGRLLRTARFVGTATYRPLPVVERAAAKVREIHRSLRGTDPRTGSRFRLDEPELLLWVHCAEVWSFVTVLTRAGFPVTARQSDRYLDEQRRTAALVGLHADEVPGSGAAMRDYFADIRPNLAHSKESEIFYHFLHRPLTASVLQCGYWPIGHLAYSLLPPWAIDLHGHPPMPAPAATLALRLFREVALLVPRGIRWRYPDGFLLQAIETLGPEATPSRHALSQL